MITIIYKDLLNMLIKLTKAIRNYADIGGKEFNQDEDEFYKMCETNDEAENLIKGLTQSKPIKEKGI